MIPLALLYFSIAVAVIYAESSRRTALPIDALRLATLFFVVAYLLIPSLLALGLLDYVNPFYFRGIRYFGSWHAPFLIGVGYLCLRIGYWLGARLAGSVDQWELRMAASDGVLLLMMIVGISIVLSSIVLYVHQFGGLRQTVIQAELIRNGVVEGGALEFVKHFFRLNGICLGYAFYCAFVRRTSTEAIRTQFRWLFGICLACFALLVFLVNGRGYVIFSVLMMYFILVNSRREFYPGRLAILVSAAALFFFFGNYVFIAAPVLVEEGLGAFLTTFGEHAGRAMENTVAGLVKGFVHPVASLEMAMEAVGGLADRRYFIDLPLGVAHLLPQRLIPVSLPDTVAFQNTWLHQGIWKSVVPPGILALGVYSIGVAGVPVIMGIYGVALGAFDRAGAMVQRFVPGAIALYVLFAFELGSFCANGEPRRFAATTFMLVVSTFVLCMFVRARRRGPAKAPNSQI